MSKAEEEYDEDALGTSLAIPPLHDMRAVVKEGSSLLLMIISIFNLSRCISMSLHDPVRTH